MHRASCRFMPPCGITETLSDVESVRVVHGESYCPEEIADRPVIFKIERIDIPENDEEKEWLDKQNFYNVAEDAYTG